MRITRLLAIEMSTASAKAMLYEGGRGVLAVASEALGPDVCDIATQDAEGAYAAIKRCVARVRAASPGTIDAVGVCTTWHSLLHLDENRKPIGRILTWANSAASATAGRYRADETLREELYSRTGCMVNSTYPLWQHVHRRATESDLVKKARYLSSQQEFLFERLTGEAAASMCVASGSGFLNINTLDWDERSLEIAGVRRDQLAPLREATWSAPLSATAAAETGLSAGIPVFVGGSDGALNQIGDGAVSEGCMTFSVGTSGALRLAAPRVVLPARPSTWCYYVAEGTRLVGAGTSGAGNCLTWFVEKTRPAGGADYRELDAGAAKADAARAPSFLPFLYGERCPGWRDDRTAGFQGIEGRHDSFDLYYAVLEGVLFNLYHCYSILTELMPEPNTILVSGGIVRSKVWLRMAADIFGKALRVSDVEHVSLLGAVGVMEKALGLVPELGRRRLGDGAVVEPDPSKADLYATRFERYLRLYEAG